MFSKPDVVKSKKPVEAVKHNIDNNNILLFWKIFFNVKKVKIHKIKETIITLIYILLENIRQNDKTKYHNGLVKTCTLSCGFHMGPFPENNCSMLLKIIYASSDTHAFLKKTNVERPKLNIHRMVGRFFRVLFFIIFRIKFLFIIYDNLIFITHHDFKFKF